MGAVSTPSAAPFTALTRVVAAMSREQPDRVPLALQLTLHGGQLLGMSIREFYADPRNVVERQVRLREKFGSDTVSGTWYAPLEYEAWGGEILWFDDGPPNAGAPLFTAERIPFLEAPRPQGSPRAMAMLESVAALRERLGPDVPIVGGVVSPNSLPIMLMGFEGYLRLLLDDRPRWEQLVRTVETWTVAWGNAQIAAGASALAYFDPVASSTIVPPALYRETGQQVAKRVTPQLKGGTVTMLASGRTVPVIGDIAETGTLAVGISSLDDLDDAVAACRGRLAIVGALNGIEMRHWTPLQAEAEVRRMIRAAAPGGLMICDNHGEIPFSVGDETLFAIRDAVHRWGRFPLDPEV
jgi:uroporphyrinogen decarboxylase